MKKHSASLMPSRTLAGWTIALNSVIAAGLAFIPASFFIFLVVTNLFDHSDNPQFRAITLVSSLVAFYCLVIVVGVLDILYIRRNHPPLPLRVLAIISIVCMLVLVGYGIFYVLPTLFA